MTKVKINWGWVLVVLLAALPILLWLLAQPFSARFATTTSLLTSIGQLAGLTGMSLFSVTLILSSRTKLLDTLFNGVNKMYIAHHFTGGLAFILLLVHPTFLTWKNLTLSLSSAVNFLLPVGDFALTLGKLALLLLIVFLVLTFFINLKYNKWHTTHKYLGAAFFLGGLHSLFIQSDVSRYAPLKFYILVLALVALAAYIYRTLLNSVLVKKYEYVVGGITKLANKIIEIELIPKTIAVNYIPGQFIFTTFDIGNSEVHPFSITSADGAKNLKIAVKDLGDYTGQLMSLRTGTVAKIEGPYGRFYNRNQGNEVWIAGGIGITPFISMARSINNTRKKITLFYSIKNASEAAFLTELNSLAAKYNNIKIVMFYSDKQGRIDAQYIASKVQDIASEEIFVCGPPPMMKSLREQFVNMGLSNSQIHSEEFALK